MPHNHQVKQGECLASIAKRYGFCDFRAVYDHARNGSFKQKRPNPNIIYPGDILFIPDKQAKQERRQASQRHAFAIPRPVKTLRIAVEDADGHRLANAPYQLSVGDVLLIGSTDGQAVLERQIPEDAAEGQLTVREHVWPLLIEHLNPVEHTPDNGVSGMQARLRNLGYDVGNVDGIAGPRTRAALEQFQREAELPVTGALDAPTRGNLLEKHGC